MTRIYAYNSDGSSFLEGNDGLFYKKDDPSSGIYDQMDSPISIADINKDGYDEIICVSGRYTGGQTEGRIFILDRTGDTITNWGYDAHTIPVTNVESGVMWLPTTSVGDIDNDGWLEIVIADEEFLHVWNHDGSVLNSNFPVSIDNLRCNFIAPLLADVDEDDQIEIIIVSNGNPGSIHCYDINGNPVVGWPLRLKAVYSTPCIDDIDNDGKNEIIATDSYEVHVWDTEGDADKIEWGKYRHDRYNSGIYGDFW